jgi:beta-glucanase (GH16 family)
MKTQSRPTDRHYLLRSRVGVGGAILALFVVVAAADGCGAEEQAPGRAYQALGSPHPGGGNGKGGATGGDDGGTGGIPVPPGYQLVWSDEFEVSGSPDPANWTYETGFVRNQEAQWYQSDNAWVDNGLLIIEARKERKLNPNYVPGSSDWRTNREYAEYTSSSLLTQGLRSWQYGRFEMRARIDTRAGLWPAWWTLGVNGEWPWCGEVDIMEYYQSKVLANVACGTNTQWVAKWDSATKRLSSLGPGWSSAFHVWRMDWNDTTISLWLDDRQMNTTALSDMLNPDGNSPFCQLHYMIANLAIGGTAGGDPSTTVFPARLEIDYIRVFQPL